MCDIHMSYAPTNLNGQKPILATRDNNVTYVRGDNVDYLSSVDIIVCFITLCDIGTKSGTLSTRGR